MASEELSLTDKLRPHQILPVKLLRQTLQQFDSAVDLSDTGTGKTYVGAAIAKGTPTLVVCPKIARSAWQRAAEHFGDTLSAMGYEMLRTGRTPFGKWDNNPPAGFERPEFFVCQSCQRRVDFDDYTPCYCHSAGIHCIITKKQAWRYGNFNFHPNIKLLIFDEVHRCNGQDSLNAKMLAAAKRQKIKTLGLSATLASSPLQMSALGHLLDLHAGGDDFYRWSRKYGCRFEPQRGLQWRASKEQQLGIMKSIHNSIVEARRGVRVRCGDIPGFPERDVVAELFDLDDGHGQIDRLYAEMETALAELAERGKNDCEHPLTQILRARQKVELLKVPIAVELASDYRAKGFSVVLFVNYRQTIDELAKRLNTDAIIDGSTAGVKNRDFIINSFQTNEINLVLANSNAGGICISMQDLDGDHPRMGLVFPTYDAVVFKQLLGRLHRDGGKSVAHYRVLLAAKTIEVKIKRALDQKLRNLDALNDGDFMP